MAPVRAETRQRGPAGVRGAGARGGAPVREGTGRGTPAAGGPPTYPPPHTPPPTAYAPPAPARNRLVRCTGSVSIFGITCSPINLIEFIVSDGEIPMGSPKLN